MAPVPSTIEFSFKSQCLAWKLQCAVKRRHLSVGEIPTRQLSFQPVAIGTRVEVTRQVKLLVQRVLMGLGEHAGRNASER